MQIGCHVSISGAIHHAIDNAVERECSAFQIFTRSPRSWHAKKLTSEDINNYKTKLDNSKIDRFATVAHMPYLPNLSSPSKDAYTKSVDTLLKEVERCGELGIPYLVTHLGSHLGTGFQSHVEKLTSFAKKFNVPTIVSTEYPPCIKHAIEVLEKGENLSHSGRFMLGTYLLGVEQTIAQIAPLFKNAPDYNEKITMYQLNHLKGRSGSGTEYKCPSCEKIKSKDLCFATSDCDGIINPLQFKKKKTLNA